MDSHFGQKFALPLGLPGASQGLLPEAPLWALNPSITGLLNKSDHSHMQLFYLAKQVSPGAITGDYNQASWGWKKSLVFI